jgi:hypothetical protein
MKIKSMKRIKRTMKGKSRTRGLSGATPTLDLSLVCGDLLHIHARRDSDLLDYELAKLLGNNSE